MLQDVGRQEHDAVVHQLQHACPHKGAAVRVPHRAPHHALCMRACAGERRSAALDVRAGQGQDTSTPGPKRPCPSLHLGCLGPVHPDPHVPCPALLSSCPRKGTPDGPQSPKKRRTLGAFTGSTVACLFLWNRRYTVAASSQRAVSHRSLCSRCFLEPACRAVACVASQVGCT